jgi:hyperosmotically inducible protein
MQVWGSPTTRGASNARARIPRRLSIMTTKTRLVALVAVLATAVAAPAFAQKTSGDMVDDGTIAASIKAGLLDNKATSAMQINVESYKGTVQLSGFVESQAEKDAAGKLATDVDGVKKVINSIAIAPKTSKLDDSLVTGKVKAALMDAKDVKSMQINVETKNGVTQLAGFVTSQGMKERAGKVAGDVSGVKQVDNVLVVKPKD